MPDLENIEKIIFDLLPFDYYQRHLKAMVRTLKLSRFYFLRFNASYLLFIQKSMSLTLEKYQKAIQEGKKLLESETDEQNKQTIKRRINTHYQLVRILQTIADGIAWRNLKYNRPIMRLLSENSGPGFIDKQIKLIMGIKSKQVLIINDLTRFCRVGDFTMVLPDGRVILYEAKKGKEFLLKDIGDILATAKKHSSPKFSVQQRRHLIVQSAFINNKIEIPVVSNGRIIKDLSVDIVDVNIKIPAYFKTLKLAIKKAKKVGYSYFQPEEGCFVGVKDYRTILNNVDKSEFIINKMKEGFNKNSPAWVKTNIPSRIIFDSYFSFYNEEQQFSRNILPYSLLPLSAHDCIDIMAGYLRIIIYYDLNYFKKLLARNGWLVTETDFNKKFQQKQPDLFDERPGRDMFKKEYKDFIFFIRRKNHDGIFSTKLSFTELLQMISSFYKTDFMLNSLEYRFNKAKGRKGRALLAFNYVGEKNILK